MQRRSSASTFRARGLSDAVDASSAFPGAMSSLQNLVLAPGSRGIFVPRPAALGVVGSGAAATKWNAFNWSGANWGGFDDAPGPAQINGLLTVGAWVYGMVASTQAPYAGFDIPFAYNLLTQSFATIAIPRGTASLPPTPLATGDWTPPTMARVAQRILVTHPGFSGGAAPFFGWLDISSFTDTTHTGSTHSSTTIDTLSANVLQAGWAPGMTIAGAGIPANTTIKSIAVGGLSLTLSQAATATAAGVALSVSGGTMTAPLWDAGNTNGQPLIAVPVAVAQFNGRAYFATQNGVQLSDSGVPCQITNTSQAVTFQNGLAVTALGGLPLYQSTGGILQSLIAFQGAANMEQITGDPATANLAVNGLGIGTGTNAPNTICNTPAGLAFVAPDGLRVVNFLGQVSDPIGKDGEGIVVPFQNAIYPSRMCAAYNQDVIRISVQNGALNTQPFQEYWFHTSEKVWTGPHTFPATLIQPYQGGGFILAAQGVDAELFSSAVLPSLSAQFSENGQPMQWQWQTCLSAENQDLTWNEIGETAIGMALPPQLSVAAVVVDETTAALGTVILNGDGTLGALWEEFDWGGTTWGQAYPFYRLRALPWSQPILCRQCSFILTGSSAAKLSIGSLSMRRQTLRAPLYAPPILTPVPTVGTVVTQG